MSIGIKVSDRMQTIAGGERPSDDALEPSTLQRALADAYFTYGIDEAAWNEFVTAINESPLRLQLTPIDECRRRHDESFRTAVAADV
jgi:hypothetical protein